MLYILLVANGYVCYFHFRGGITMSDTTGNIIKKVLLLEKNTSPTCANYNTIKKVSGYIRGLSYLKHNDTKVRIKAYKDCITDCKISLSNSRIKRVNLE